MIAEQVIHDRFDNEAETQGCDEPTERTLVDSSKERAHDEAFLHEADHYDKEDDHWDCRPFGQTERVEREERRHHTDHHHVALGEIEDSR